MPASALSSSEPVHSAEPLAPFSRRELIGTATLVRMAYEGQDLAQVFSSLNLRAMRDPWDAAALYDLSILLQATGQRDKALDLQKLALSISRRFTRRNGDGRGLRVLVIATMGDLMANTPVDFLLEASNATQEIVFVDQDHCELEDLPHHDVAFLAVGESPDNAATLTRLETALRDWPGPILNNAPLKISSLTRDGVADLFHGATSVVAPKTVRLLRDEAMRIALSHQSLADHLPGGDYPIIARPVGSHAGTGLEKIASPEALRAFLEREAAHELFIAPFVDYGSADGLYRKQRIAFIDGVPYASHLAISNHWMVHYLNAGMFDHAERRAEEARWMATFETDTAQRMSAAFAEVQRQIGLDYFAIDCAELADGRLLLFEADVAMIVHALDSDSLFPYKKPAMTRLFTSFLGALENRARRHPTHA